MTDTFLIALGDELRRARKQRGWTRRDLIRRVPFNASLQTLATYELGTRHVSVARFVDLADALDEPAEELLTWARRRVGLHYEAGLLLDLEAVARTQRAKLGPLRRWAQSRLDRRLDGEPTAVQLDLTALDHLAQVCGMSTVDLIRQLTHPEAGLVRRNDVGGHK